jgi:hypothetical protein
MLFLVVLFLIRDTSIFKKTINFVKGNQENGLTYGNATIEELVNKDTDGDGIPDWEERLYGLDPTKKETTPGISDSTALSKLQIEKGEGTSGINGGVISTEPEKLTQTEQFSRELFATVAASSQNGTMDQATIDALGSSLAEKIEKPVVRKVFTTSDLKIINDDSVQSVKKYNKTMDDIHVKYPIKGSIIGILQKFVADQNNLNVSALADLDPIITQMKNIIKDGAKMSVPQSLVSLHLDFLNAGERVVENLNDVQLFESDPILAMGAIIQYNANATSLEMAAIRLKNTIEQKIKD